MNDHSLTIVYSLFNPTREIIDAHLNNWKSYPSEALSKIYFVMIDDFSDEVVQIKPAFPINLTTARILEDKGWNNGGAKNLGFSLSNTQWTLHTDKDHFIVPEVITYLLNFNPTPNTAYYFKRIRRKTSGTLEIRHRHENSYMIETAVFHKLGGYDEDMSGCYGFEDSLLNHQIEVHNIQKVILDLTLLELELFKTPNYNRDTSRNLAIWREKLRTENYKPGPMLRFQWKITESYKYE